MTKDQRDEAKAKAWAHYVKVRDAEEAKFKALHDKHGDSARGWGRRNYDPDDIRARVKAEIEAKYKKEIAAADKLHAEEKARAEKIVNEARAKKDVAIRTAWQAFEMLDVGGRTPMGKR